MKIPTIETKNFTLRPFKKGDDLSLRKNINNKKIYKNTLLVPYPYTAKDAKNWVSINLKEQKKKKPKEINFVIDVNGEDIGSVGFSNICEFHKAEICNWLAEKYWNNGIMTEAIKIATKFGFDKLKLKKIYAHVFSFNKASMRVFEKNNYKLEGILKKNVKKGDKLVDDYFFAKIK